MTDTIENDARISEIRYCPGFAALCRIGNQPFHGQVEIVYEPSERLLEFESFERWLAALGNKEVTIEEVARLSFDELTRALGDIPLCVTVHARTTVHAPVSATIRRK